MSLRTRTLVSAILTPSSTAASGPSLSVDLHPGKPPVLHAHAAEDAASWAAEHRHALRSLVTEHGALLIRGLGLRDTGQVGAVFHHLTPGLMSEREAFAPRDTYTPGVYSSTAWPAAQPMCMHHELSYTHTPPGLLLLACLTPPATGGATALADAATVLDALPPQLVQRFEEEGWLLARTYNDEIGASWAEAFGTDDKAAVEDYCRANRIDFSWGPDGTLRTRQSRHAVMRHPVTGRRCWFNQVAFLNEWTMAPEVREYLIDVYGPDGLPFNTRFGGGDPIGEDVVELINTVYETHTVREPWQAGDLMLVDNVRTAHSREPYEPPRDVLVAMAEPLHPTPCTPALEGSAR
ncbi:TauD/TfdA family dioxygenase [Streptomyces sp. PSKA54]|uniref:TauD/TfdA family dioxygenase n=1 Tax=Streptomyces himalayensis subsp. aureolus TaxID=2758039 RepID=A0A7W2D4M0_9ACTN|nr:TauD/TfdA family dioxygenase [Streptomyces himalayensis]MBA4864687.1 TauD/TfdA family dioxygenase [Streptomyces himalayensis subsp. aureolus]